MREIKGFPYYRYKDGYTVYLNEEYWGRVHPLFKEYYLVSPKGELKGECSKGDIRRTLKQWGEAHGKRTRIDD